VQRKILVTGGNRGIGLAIVQELAKNKEDIILLGSRNLDEGKKATENLGGNIIAVHLDLTDRDELKNSLQSILEDHHRIDVLINNSGVLHQESILDLSTEKLDESLRVNTIAPFEIIQTVLPGMMSSGYGRIVNISSGWASFHEGLHGPCSYSVSKAALNALTKSIAQGLPSNIKINCMCPGWVRTRMGGLTAPRSPEKGAETAVWLSNLDENGPSGEFFRDKKNIGW
jgi:NAD(P)-dependent dehydrogenase (short-subunit alcohol dehydrogenase family)